MNRETVLRTVGKDRPGIDPPVFLSTLFVAFL